MSQSENVDDEQLDAGITDSEADSLRDNDDDDEDENRYRLENLEPEAENEYEPEIEYNPPEDDGDESEFSLREFHTPYGYGNDYAEYYVYHSGKYYYVVFDRESHSPTFIVRGILNNNIEVQPFHNEEESQRITRCVYSS